MTHWNTPFFVLPVRGTSPVSSILTIAQKEWKTLFRSPLTWVALALMQIVFAWLYLVSLEGWLQIQAQRALQGGGSGITAWLIDQCFAPASTVLMAIAPLLTMRLLAAERGGTGIELLLSSPVSPGQIVLGKFVAALSIYALLLLQLALMPLALLPFVAIDIGALATAVLGLLLFCSACCAVGVYFSSLTRQTAVAALGSFGALFLLWVVGIAQTAAESGLTVFGYLSLARHLQTFLTGLLDSTDIVYYLLVCSVFLTLAIRHIDNLRMQSR